MPTHMAAYTLQMRLQCGLTTPGALPSTKLVPSKEVAIRNTGHEKLRITVLLCARENGMKCKPYVLLNRKRPIPEVVKEFSGKLVLSWSGKLWMDDESTSDFLDRVLGRALFQSRLLVWDAFHAHLSKATKAHLRKINLHTAVVPGGCTKFVQAPDVCWNKPFKAKIQDLYEEWMDIGEKSYTTAGNLRAPSIATLCSWIVAAWDSLSSDMILKSFKVCGVSNAVDGSEDGEIHCFKPSGPCAEGLALLKEKHVQMFESGQQELADLDMGNEEETGEDESDKESDNESVHSVELTTA